jgi:nucleotide-binding universal stress UspA family protein
MAIIAFVDDSSSSKSVIDYSVWAAKSMAQPLAFVSQDDAVDSEPSIAYDAYQQMDVREDMYRELATRSRSDYPVSDSSAVDIVQSAARRARELGVQRIRTITTSESPLEFIDTSTDSDDLLILPRHDESESRTGQWIDQFLKARKRVMLLVPETYSPVTSWLIAIDGKPAIGRAVDFLSGRPLLSPTPGMAVFVGNDYQNRLHFRDAVKHLEGTGHTITSHELKGSPDDVLAAVLAVSHVDLLVMGAYGQGRFRSLLERSTTSGLLETFRGPVLVARA